MIHNVLYAIICCSLFLPPSTKAMRSRPTFAIKIAYVPLFGTSSMQLVMQVKALVNYPSGYGLKKIYQNEQV